MTTQALRLPTLTVPRLAVRARALAPSGIYLAGQMAALLVLMLAAHAHHRGLYGLLVATWDGKDFLAIAQHGYSHSVLAGHDPSVAFFPGYPLALRALHAGTHLSVGVLAVLVSVTAGLVFAQGLNRLVGSGRLGLIVVALAAVSPLSIVLMMAYSEALFCALAVWALVFMRDRSWLAAGLLTALALTVRSTGIALVVALAIAVLLAPAPTLRTAWRPLVALAIAPIGGLAYLAWADNWTGVHRSWFAAERNGWGSRVDFGVSLAQWSYRAVMFAPAVLDVATVVILIAALILLGHLGWRSRNELTAYAVVVVALDVLNAGPTASKVRLLIAAFPLLIPLARYIIEQPAKQRAWLLTGTTVAGCWYSAYALTMYGYGL